MKKLMLMLALSVCIGFSVSAQVPEKENEDMPMQEKPKMDQEHKGEHWVMKDGKVIHMNNGMETVIDTETEVNGVWIRPNGQVVMKDNKTIKLKEGQYVDSMGKIHHMMKKKSSHKK